MVGEPLDEKFLQFRDDMKLPSRQDWQSRLKEAGGGGAVVPIGNVDPRKDLLALVPGKGMDFRDMCALSELKDTYQVVILISDHNQPWDHGGRHIADALQQFLENRQALGDALGVRPSTIVRLIGHSAGTLTSQAMLVELAKRGILSDRQDSLISRIGFWAIDGPWRGVDMPWLVQISGLKYLGPLLVHPPIKLDRGAQSVINRLGRLMDIVTQDLGLPSRLLTTRHVFATGMQDTSPRLRHFEPVSSILWEELGEGEGEVLYEFLKENESLDQMKANRNDLDSFSPTGLTRRRGLQNLVLVLIRDCPKLVEELHDLAKNSTLDQFGVGFNPTVNRYIRTYPGQHTRFMWTDPTFLNDMRKELQGV